MQYTLKSVPVLPPAVFDLLDMFYSLHAFRQYNAFLIKSTMLCQSNETLAEISTSISTSHL